MTIFLRESIPTDVARMQIIRHSVKENVLSDPRLVTDEDVLHYMQVRGKGWVAEMDGEVQGFAIVDLREENVWALFVHPHYENKGIGKQLHDTMLDWYFSQGKTYLWLSTDPKTRAELFYRKHGWQPVGTTPNGEVKFERNSAN